MAALLRILHSDKTECIKGEKHTQRRNTVTMSLLSRFRKSVMPSSMRSKKSIDNDVQQQNYRKPTKSFNEKSVKSKKSSLSHANHADDGSYYNDLPERNQRSISKLSTRSPSMNANKSMLKNIRANNNTPRHHNGNGQADNGNLSRSDTFTLDDEKQIQSGTYPRSKKIDKSPGHTDNSGCRDEIDLDRSKGMFDLFCRFCLDANRMTKKKNIVIDRFLSVLSRPHASHTKYILNGTHFSPMVISSTNFAAILLSFAN